MLNIDAILKDIAKMRKYCNLAVKPSRNDVKNDNNIKDFIAEFDAGRFDYK